MRITRLRLDERPDGLRSEPTDIAPGLTIVTSHAAHTRERVAGLVAQLLHGRGSASAHDAGGEGFIDVDHANGRLRLRRRALPDQSFRLTISRLDGSVGDPPDQHALLGGLPARVVQQVFEAAGPPDDQIARLLSEGVARAFRDLDRRPPAAAGRETSLGETARRTRSELLARRNTIARRIEKYLAENRRRSADVEREINDIESETRKLRERRDGAQERRATVERELLALESRLRCQAISNAVRHESDRRDTSGERTQIDELDQEIERWRTTLADLELRESRVRNALAATHPDDACPSLPLADQRAGLAVVSRLLQDLEGEVARLARAADSRACVCRDAHSRINPLVETLAQQAARLRELASQQEQAFQAQHLKSEAEHLSRSQADLQQQLDHLLSRRQEAWRSTRTKLDAVAPGAEEAPPAARSELQAKLARCDEDLAAIEDALGRLEAQRRASYESQRRLLDASELTLLQTELARVQEQLQREPSAVPQEDPDDALERPWRASELMARLSDGRYVALRLVRGGRELAAADCGGVERPVSELPTPDRALVSLALRLALVWAAAERGIHVPLVLHAPFRELDAQQTVTATTVLDDFGRAGRQVLVTTARREALDRCETLGAAILDVDATPSQPGSVAALQSPSQSVRTETPVRPDYLFSPEDRIERFPTPFRDRSAVFARARVYTVGDLLCADPSALAEELGRGDVSAELAALWQTHLGLVCFVPRLSLDDATALACVGVLEPADLANADPDSLCAAIERHLRSERGARFRSRGYTVDRAVTARWAADAQHALDRWEGAPTWDAWRRHRGERRERLVEAGVFEASRGREEPDLSVHIDDAETTRFVRSDSKPSVRRASERERRSAGQFHLGLSSPVGEAPSIGPKTAKRLERLGVRTVADLLDADPEQVCGDLRNERITAEMVVAWQHEAELVCRVPQIRAREARLLVACGFTCPEEIASMKPAELLAFVEPYATSEQGRGFMREGTAPDLEHVSDWINWARESRVLDAA